MKKTNFLMYIKKSLIITLTLFMGLGVAQTGSIVKAATEDVNYNIEEIYADDKTSVELKVEASAKDETVEVVSITDPNGEKTDGRMLSYQATENKTYNFIVNYKKNNSQEGGAEWSDKTYEIAYEVKEIAPIQSEEKSTEAVEEVEEEEATAPSELGVEAMASRASGGVSLGSATNVNVSGTTQSFKYGNAMVSVNPGALEISVNTGSFQLGSLPTSYMSANAVTEAGVSTPYVNTATRYKSVQFFSSATINAQDVVRNATFYVGLGVSQTATVKIDSTTLSNLGVSAYNGHYYKYVGMQTTFDSAVSLAPGQVLWGVPGYLATITSAGENSFVRGTVVGNKWLYSNAQAVWLGAQKAGSSWLYATGPEAGQGLQYSNWIPGQPDNAYGGQNATCLWNGPKNTTGYGWQDAKKTYPATYVIEWSEYGNYKFSLNNYTGIDSVTTVGTNPDQSSVSARDATLSQAQARALANSAALVQVHNATGRNQNGNYVVPNVSTNSWSAITNGTVGNYPVTFTAGSKSITVYLTIVADPDQSSVVASNATITQTQAMALTSMTSLVSVHNASGKDKNGNIVIPTVTTNSWSSISTGVVGSYTITFTAGTASKNVTLTITADQKHIVNANDSFIYQSQAKALSNTTQLIPYNSATVVTNAGVVAVPDTVSTPGWASITAGNIGSYAVTYSYGSGNAQGSKTVKLNVIKDKDIISPNKKFSIHADDMILSQSEAKKLSSESSLVSTHNASVTLADGTNLAPFVSSNGNWNAIHGGVIGSYKVSFSYVLSGDSATKDVTLTIVDDADIISPDKQAAIHAEDASITQTQAKAITGMNDIVTYMNAYVTKADGTKDVAQVNTNNYSSIKAGIVGTYPITYSYGSGTNAITKTPILTVSGDPKHTISAVNGWIESSQAQALVNVDGLIPYNNATVTTISGSIAAPTATSASWANIKAGTTGIYDVTYSYGSGSQAVSITVKIGVIPDGTVHTRYALIASGGYIEESAAKALVNQNELIPYNKASVLDLDTGNTLTPNVSALSFSSIKAGIIGNYDVSYSYGSGNDYITKTVNLSVIPDGTPVFGDFAIIANGNVITQSEARAIKGLTDFYTINSAKVVLFKTGQEVQPNVSVPDYATIKAGTLGTYGVDYSYTLDGVSGSKAVNVVVCEDGDPHTKNFALHAQDATITINEAKALVNQSDLIVYNNAKVTLVSDGSIVNPNINLNATDWNAIKAGQAGTYDVTYSYGSGSEYRAKTVKITVGSGVVPPDRSFILYAQDAIISPAEAQALANMDAIIPYNKATVTLANGSKATPSISTANFADIKAGKEGSYDITYKYGSGANEKTISVKLTIANGIGTNFKLNANHCILTIAEAQALVSRNDLIALHQATVTLKDGTKVNPNVSLTSASWVAIQSGTVGVYDVMFTYTQDGETRDVSKKLTVYDPNGGTISPDKDFVIYAHGAIITESEAKALTGQSAINMYTDASVGMADGSSATPTINVAQYATIKAGTKGLYDVVYSYGTGSKATARTVKLRVVDDNTIISPNRTYALYAEDTKIDKTIAMGLKNKEDLIPICKAIVYLEDGTTLDPAVVANDFVTIKNGTLGNYTVTFTYKELNKNITLGVSTTYTERLLFDYNANGKLDIADKAILHYLITNPSQQTAIDILLGDANGNGQLDVADKAQLNFYLTNPTITVPTVKIPN